MQDCSEGLRLVFLKSVSNLFHSRSFSLSLSLSLFVSIERRYRTTNILKNPSVKLELYYFLSIADLLVILLFSRINM